MATGGSSSVVVAAGATRALRLRDVHFVANEGHPLASIGAPHFYSDVALRVLVNGSQEQPTLPLAAAGAYRFPSGEDPTLAAMQQVRLAPIRPPCTCVPRRLSHRMRSMN
jgi:hypothetical protein